MIFFDNEYLMFSSLTFLLLLLNYAFNALLEMPIIIKRNNQSFNRKYFALFNRSDFENFYY